MDVQALDVFAWTLMRVRSLGGDCGRDGDRQGRAQRAFAGFRKKGEQTVEDNVFRSAQRKDSTKM